MEENQRMLRQGILLALGILAVLAGTRMALGRLYGDGVPAVLAGILLIWLLGTFLMLRRPLFRDLEPTLCAILGALLCLLLRLILFDYVSPDYVSFLGPWTEQMRNMTIRQALITPIGDYNMPYLYVLLLISRLPVYDLYCIKLVSVASDMMMALAAARLTRLYTRRSGLILAAFFGMLLAPTVFLNSGYWAQCDGVYACFVLWGLYWVLRNRPMLSASLLAAAFAFKLQTVFFLPVVVFLLISRRMSFRDLLAFPLTFLLVVLPAMLAGRSFSDTFGIYFSQTESYPYFSLSCPNFWSLVPNDFFHYLDPMPVLLAGIVTLLLLYGFLRRPRQWNGGELISLGMIFCLAIPWLLPRMHERYFYLAEVMSVVYAARFPRRFPVALVQLSAGFLAYCSYLFGGMRVLSNELVAVILGIQLVYLVLRFLRDTDGGPHKPVIHLPIKEETSDEKTGIPLE